MKTANNQEVFDTVVRHLLKQGKRATKMNICAYRGENGTKCAVGCLIKDEFYSSKELEGRVASHPAVMKALIDSGVVCDLNFLSRLQHIHDCYPPVCWLGQLMRQAEICGLTFPKSIEE